MTSCSPVFALINFFLGKQVSAEELHPRQITRELGSVGPGEVLRMAQASYTTAIYLGTQPPAMQFTTLPQMHRVHSADTLLYATSNQVWISLERLYLSKLNIGRIAFNAFRDRLLLLQVTIPIICEAFFFFLQKSEKHNLGKLFFNGMMKLLNCNQTAIKQQMLSDDTKLVQRARERQNPQTNSKKKATQKAN